jgi:hypothetical protein
MAIAWGRGAAGAALAVGLFFLAGCGSRINRDNFYAIKYGMTMPEVEKILGPGGKQMTKAEVDKLLESKAPPKSRGMGGGPGGNEAAEEDKTEPPSWYLWGDAQKYILVAFRKDDGGELKVLTWTASNDL